MLSDIIRDQRKSRLKKINGAWKKTMLKLVASRRLVWEHKARECPVFLTVMDTFYGVSSACVIKPKNKKPEILAQSLNLPRPSFCAKKKHGLTDD